eukprot:scaffold82017_cov34-Prasinocladus_malaysianus.AAC.1
MTWPGRRSSRSKACPPQTPDDRQPADARRLQELVASYHPTMLVVVLLFRPAATRSTTGCCRPLARAAPRVVSSRPCRRCLPSAIRQRTSPQHLDRRLLHPRRSQVFFN